MIKNNVSAVIVTYFPDLLHLKQLIEKIDPQVNQVIICDNSSANLDIHGFVNKNIKVTNSKVKIFKFNENLGIGEAQNKGMEWAYANNANFVLHLDQDSMPDLNLVKNLINSYYELIKLDYNVGLLGSTYKEKISNKLHEKSRWYYQKSIDQNNAYSTNSFLISSGTLIPKLTYKKIGQIESNLFIDLVDFEYCWRAAKFNLSVHLVRQARIENSVGKGIKKVFFNLYEIMHSVPIREYYLTRNTIILAKRNYVPLIWKVINLSRIVIRLILNPIFLDNGFLRIKYIFVGIYHGLTSKTGKY